MLVFVFCFWFLVFAIIMILDKWLVIGTMWSVKMYLTSIRIQIYIIINILRLFKKNFKMGEKATFSFIT